MHRIIVVLVRIEGAVAGMLEGMPTMIDCASGAYILPPIPYPDGHVYLKIGVGSDADAQPKTLQELQEWFRGPGSPEDRIQFTALLKALIPALAHCAHWRADSCAVTYTAKGLPIIDFVHDDRIAVAVGGCGKGAKGVGEWGRIAADLVQQKPWTSAAPRESLNLD